MNQLRELRISKGMMLKEAGALCNATEREYCRVELELKRFHPKYDKFLKALEKHTPKTPNLSTFLKRYSIKRGTTMTKVIKQAGVCGRLPSAIDNGREFTGRTLRKLIGSLDLTHEELKKLQEIYVTSAMERTV